MFETQKIIYVICEGKSETAYLNELNKTLKEEDIGIIFKPQNANGGNPREINAAFSKIRKELFKHEAVTWLDKDIYVRDPSLINELSAGIPDLKFNYMNFEDFIALHLCLNKALKWNNTCNQEKHFQNPMHGNKYMPLFKQICFNEYQKGSLPIIIDTAALRAMFINNKDNKLQIRSDFAEYLYDNLHDLI